MTQQEFESTVKNDYRFDTFFSYFWATASISLSLFIIYDLLFTSSSTQINIVEYLTTFIVGVWGIYFGIRGFIVTKYLFNIEKIDIIKSNNNLKLIFDEIAEANGFKKLFEYQTAAIYNTKSYFRHQKKLYVFFDQNFILLNIQQQQYRGIKFLNFSGSKKILKRIVTQLRLQVI